MRLKSFIFSLTFLLGFCAVFLNAQSSFAAIFYVSTTGNDGNDCATDLTPCLTIQGAIGKAANSDTINIAAGTYANASIVNFGGKYLKLHGNSRDDTFVTFSIANSIQGMGNGGTSTIENLNLQSSAGSYLIKIENAPVIVQNCILSSTSYWGIHVQENQVIIRNNEFIKMGGGNAIKAGTAGSTPLKLIVTGNTFSAIAGQSIWLSYEVVNSMISIANNKFVGNTQAAIYLYGNSTTQELKDSTLISNNTFIGMSGTAVVNDAGDFGRRTIKNNIFAFNKVAEVDSAYMSQGFPDRNYNLTYDNATVNLNTDTGAVTTNPQFTQNETGTISARGSTTLTDSTKSWTTDQWKGYFLNASSTSADRRRSFWRIKSNDATTLTVEITGAANEIQDYSSVGNTYYITNLTLQGGSPAINAGHPDAMWNDADASRNDMGYTGGPTDLVPQVEFQYPTINAVKTSSAVTMNAISVNNLPGTTLDYLWSQTSGGAVVLSSTIVEQPTFTAPNSVDELTFEVTVTDSNGQSYTSREVTYYVHQPVLVNAGGSYDSIAAAVTAASSGDTITIGEGVYPESVDTTKNLTIEGAGEGLTLWDGLNITHIVGSSQILARTATAGATTTVRDITFQNNDYSTCVYLAPSTTGTFNLTDITVQQCSNGIVTLNQAGSIPTVNGTNITANNNTSNGIYMISQGGAKTWTNVVLVGNGVYGYQGTAGSHIIRKSVVANNPSSIFAPDMTVEDSLIVNSTSTSISTGSSADADIYLTNNTIYGMTYTNLSSTAYAFIFKNNIFAYATANAGFSCPAGLTFTRDYNLYYNLLGSVDADCPAIGANDITDVPLFAESATGVSEGLSATTMTDNEAAWVVNQWVGYFLLPDTSTSAKTRRAFYILSNTANTITVATSPVHDNDMNDNSLAVGNTYIITNFNLKTGSPARDSADAATATASDIVNTARPVGAGDDRGAYELVYVNTDPNAPSSLGPANLVDGSTGDDNTPTYTFTLTDPNTDDRVKYQIQIDNSADFGSLVVDYTCALGSQGSTSFTVGQAAGLGTYTTGNEAQTLADGNYYWRVKTIDNGSASSAYTTANGGAIAHVVNTVPPAIVQFTNTTSNGSETVTSPSIEVSIAEIAPANVTVDYNVTGGTAAGGGVDFTLAAGTATITAGQTTTTIPFTVINDENPETNETIVVTLSNPSANAELGANTVHTYTILDNDALRNISVNDAGLVENNGTLQFTVSLDSASGSTITVDYATVNNTATSGNDYTTTGNTLTFTPGQTTKTVDVTILGDTMDEDNETFYLNLSNATNATIDDNQGVGTITDNDDQPNLTINDLSADELDEGTQNFQFTLTLSAASGKNVNVSNYATAAGTATAGEDFVPVSDALTFNPGETTKNVIVTVKGDFLVEDDENFFLNIAATTNATVTDNQGLFTIRDDDTAGITVTESGGATNVTEGGATDTFTVVLDSEPANNVVITLTRETEDILLSIAELTFTPDNWATPQTVTVTANNDALDEELETSNISFAVDSTDPNYEAFVVADLTTNIVDNDLAGVSVDGVVAIAEGGATGTYTIVLTTLPADTVTITLATADGETTAAPSPLTFTVANWNTPQEVTVTAVDDLIAEGNHIGVITHTATSADPDYNAIAVLDMNAAITDDDTAGVTITQSGGNTAISEDGTTDTYEVVLSSPPTATVTISIATDTQLETSSATLSFTTTNWNTPQTVTVNAVDDDDVEGLHNATITHTVTSADALYNGLAVSAVTVAIEDNDHEGDGTFDVSLMAGNDFQAIEGTTVRLTATLSNPGDLVLTYQWSQVSGPSATIINGDSLTASLIVPTPESFNRYITFCIVATDGENTTACAGDALITLHIIPKEINTQFYPGHSEYAPYNIRTILTDANRHSRQLAVSGTIVTETDAYLGPNLRHAIVFGETRIFTASDELIQILSWDHYLIIGDPLYDDNRGLLAIIDTSRSLPHNVDLADSSTQSAWHVILGENGGDLYGRNLSLLTNEDNTTFLAISAPGWDTGSVFIVSLDELTIEEEISGSSTERLKTTRMLTADMDNDGTEDIILGTTESETVATTTTTFVGFVDPLGSDHLSNEAPSFVFETDSPVDLSDCGDINGDGYDDCVFASSHTCALEVLFGSSSLDVLSLSEETYCSGEMTALAVGDVTGDGLADIVLGFANDGDGVVDIIIGRIDLDVSNISFADAFSFLGDENEGLGADILLIDYNGDGQRDILSHLANEDNTTKILNVENIVYRDPGSWQGLTNGTYGCALHKQTNGTFSYWWLGLFLLSWLKLRTMRVIV